MDTQPERHTPNAVGSVTRKGVQKSVLPSHFFFHFLYVEKVYVCTRKQDAHFQVNEKTGPWRASGLPLPVPCTLCK